jgi:hypothetical protein
MSTEEVEAKVAALEKLARVQQSEIEKLQANIEFLDGFVRTVGKVVAQLGSAAGIAPGKN